MAFPKSMVLTRLHLRPEQKRLLQARAKERGANLGEELRASVDFYLHGITPEKLDWIDQISIDTEKMLTETTQVLMATNAHAMKIFKTLESLQAQKSA